MAVGGCTYKFGQQRGAVFLVLERMVIATPILAICVLKAVGKREPLVKRAINSCIVCYNAVAAELLFTVAVICRGDYQRIAYTHSPMVPSRIYSVIVIVVGSIHLLAEVVARVVVKCAALVMCCEVLVL